MLSQFVTFIKTIYNDSEMKINKNQLVSLIAILLICVLMLGGSTFAQDSFFFSETGHTISGNFLEYYLSYPNAEVLFGYPITEIFSGELGNRLQYFDKVRFEEDAFGEVSLSPIGKLAYTTGNLSIEQDSLLSCQRMNSWEFSICFHFLNFYYSNGGELLFGKPISSMENEKGLIVQYFENVKMEWNPNDLGTEIRMSNLGTLYFNLKSEDSTLLIPILSDNYQYEILELNAQVFVEDALLESGEMQTLYVYATDQNGVPVPDVNIYSTLFIRSNGEKLQEIPAAVTNKNGIVVVYFIPEYIQNEIVRVIVTLNSDALTTNFETSFRLLN
jgi:hypothetical protein